MNILTKLTKRNLILNKKRAIGTIIGIILSVALICAVSGMFMVSSAAHRGAPVTDRDARTHIYSGVQLLAERYRGECGSIVCRELLGLKQQKDAPVPEERTPDYYKRRPCSEYVALSARMVGEYLNGDMK